MECVKLVPYLHIIKIIKFDTQSDLDLYLAFVVYLGLCYDGVFKQIHIILLLCQFIAMFI